MTDETFILLILCFVMLLGSYIAGNIPLVMKLSEVRLVLLKSCCYSHLFFVGKIKTRNCIWSWIVSRYSIVCDNTRGDTVLVHEFRQGVQI